MTAGDAKRRVKAFDLVVEGALSGNPSRRRDERSPEGEEPGLDLSRGPLRAIGGALARYPGTLQPVGLVPQALRPLEEAGVISGVLADGGSRKRDQRRVRPFFSTPLATEQPAEHTPGS